VTPTRNHVSAPKTCSEGEFATLSARERHVVMAGIVSYLVTFLLLLCRARLAFVVEHVSYIAMLSK